jgi:glycosyltransferase involved in cell wall biosynthesis
MRIAFLSHTAMGGSFVVGSHHLAAALAARGHEVQHVSAPVTPAHVLGLRDGFTRQRFARFLRGGEIRQGVRDIVPLALLPWALARSRPVLMHAHSRWMLATPLRSVTSLQLTQADHLIVDEPRMLGIAWSRGARATLAYRATDLYAAMRGDARIADAERLLCRRADVIVATSEQIAAHLRALSGRHVHVIGNGVDYARFAAPQPLAPTLPGERARRAIYVGAFDARFCAQSLCAAADELPAHTFVLAGPGGERIAAELARPNIHATGAVPYEFVPALLQACAVGLLPFSANGANAGRSPMKLFEYAAAGLPVAASSAFRPGRAMPNLSIAGAHTDFARAVAAAFEHAADAGEIARAREVARAEDWAAKAAELLRLMQHARAEANLQDAPEGSAVGEPLLPVRNSWS